jgi:ADP-heptose:LPS heptosyltransferase
MDAVHSSHLLEHVEDYKAALKEWWRVIKPGGHLVLYLPHKDYYPHIGQGGNPDHKHDFLPSDIVEAMREMKSGWDLVIDENRNDGSEYSFLQVFRKRSDGVYKHASSRPRKTALVVRYGGFGDMIIASSVFPLLKKQGYHLTLNTTPRGYDIVKNDPNIDAFLIQDFHQVPHGELRDYWEALSKRYDHFVNLTETVETGLLAIPDHAQFYWPKEARHALLNFNYLELAHLIAGVPPQFSQHFYPTLEEREWARKERNELGGKVLVWATGGSSVHKAWPYMDIIIARILLEYPEWKIVLVGDRYAKDLIEAPWVNEPRIIRRCDEWEIRKTLAFSEVADAVIGPETGVLNAVSMLDMPKIIFLSHSSVENLTKYWKNTVSLEPVGCQCYPCHMLHHGWAYCKQEEITGASVCSARIGVEQVWRAFTDFYPKKVNGIIGGKKWQEVQPQIIV